MRRLDTTWGVSVAHLQLSKRDGACSVNDDASRCEESFARRARDRVPAEWSQILAAWMVAQLKAEPHMAESLVDHVGLGF